MQSITSCGCALLAALALSACGGGGSGGSTPLFVAPPLGQKIAYRVTDTDNSHNTIPWQLVLTVVSSAADGSYSQSVVGNGGSATVNGTRYGTVNEVDIYNASHELTSYAVAGNPSVTCSYDVPKPPLPTNLPVGQAWPVVSNHVACTNGLVFDRTLQNGSVVGVESVDVPAGTFTANKVQFSLVTTVVASAMQRTESLTQWRDSVSGRLVKSVNDISYTNPSTTAGYLVNEVEELLTAP